MPTLGALVSSCFVGAPVFRSNPWKFGPTHTTPLMTNRSTGELYPSRQSADHNSLPSLAEYARNVLLDELVLAVDELPAEQREVFVGHELEGRSFKEMAAETGVSVNTLLSRKRYAVLHLRKRLQSMYDELTKA